ncbi:MAG: hypothetical protein IPM18_15690 [Phycisphaerales bacterium]|nr:hypothetical protein [Phycisphaerales bacterium]
MSTVPMDERQRETRERVVQQQLSRRRWRVVRGVLVFCVLSAAMLTMALINREQEAIVTCESRLREAQQIYAEIAALPDRPLAEPSDLGVLGEDYLNWWAREIVGNWRYDSQAISAGTSWAAACNGHIGLFGPSLRHVLIYESRSRTYRIVTLSESEFRERGSTFGFEVAANP